MTYEFSDPPPWAHQRDAVINHGDRRVLALNFDTRTGKSRTALDTAAYRYEKGDIDAVLIIAYPSGVPRNWIENELVYIPERIQHRSILWKAGSDKLVWWNRRFKNLLEYQGFAIFAVNAEALSNTNAAVKKYISRFLAMRRVFLIVDEVDAFITPGSSRSKSMTQMARHPNIMIKRILSATMITETPFEAYSQYNILDRRILNCPTYLAFKHRYGEYDKEYDPTSGEMIIKKFYNHKTKTYFETLAKDDKGRPKYRNLEDLQRRIAPYTLRVRRADISDAPRKVFQIRYFQLNPEQRRVYNDLRDQYYAELQSGALWTAREAVVRLTRLQQIASNFLPSRQEGLPCQTCQGQGCDECDQIGIILTTTPLQRLADTNPRLEAIKTEITTHPVQGGVVIWCRFTAEIDELIHALPKAVRYDGKTTEHERAQGLAAFQAGEVNYLIGNQQAGSRGVRMSRAGLMIYASNNWSLRSRIQSEDRAEAIDKTYSTGIVDLVAEDTVDERLITTLRAKRDLSETISNLKDWI